MEMMTSVSAGISLDYDIGTSEFSSHHDTRVSANTSITCTCRFPHLNDDKYDENDNSDEFSCLTLPLTERHTHALFHLIQRQFAQVILKTQEPDE